MSIFIQYMRQTSRKSIRCECSRNISCVCWDHREEFWENGPTSMTTSRNACHSRWLGFSHSCRYSSFGSWNNSSPESSWLSTNVFIYNKNKNNNNKHENQRLISILLLSIFSFVCFISILLAITLFCCCCWFHITLFLQ